MLEEEIQTGLILKLDMLFPDFLANLYEVDYVEITRRIFEYIDKFYEKYKTETQK